jgi:hypothetical protein
MCSGCLFVKYQCVFTVTGTSAPTGSLEQMCVCVYTHDVVTRTTLFNSIWRGECSQIISTCISMGFMSSVL